MKYIKKFDLFGRNIQILFNNQRNHKTQFGGFVTLFLLVGFIVFLYIQYSQSLIPRQLVRNTVHVENQKRYDLNKNVLNIVFGLQNSKFEHYIDETLYNISALLVTQNKLQNHQTGQVTTESSQIEVKIEQCREDHFTINETKDYFMSLNYKGMYCFAKDQDLPIEGDFDSERYSYIQLLVKPCENKVECQDAEVIDKMYEFMCLALYFSDNVIQLSESSDPFVVKNQDVYVISGIPLAKEVSMYFQNTRIVDLGGIYNEQIDSQEKLTFDKIQEQVYPYKKGEYMFKLNIRHTKNFEMNVVRNFQPFSVLLSQLGGFYQILIGIGCLLCYPVSQIDLNIKLINSLFNIDPTPSEEDHNKSQSPKNNKNNNQKDDKSDLYIDSNNDKSKCFGLFNKNNNSNQKSLQQLQSVTQTDHTQTIINNNHNNSNSKQSNKKYQQVLNRMGSLIGQQQQQQQVDEERNTPELKFAKSQGSQQITSPNIPNIFGMQKQNNNACSPHLKNVRLHKKQLQRQHSIIGINGSLIVSDQVLTKIAKIKDQLKQMNLFKKYFQVNSVQFSLWNYIKLNIMCCKRYQDKKKQLNKSVTQLYSQLDVHNILQKLIEIDKIKMIILNDNQRKLFEYLPQPKIFASSSPVYDPFSNNNLNYNSPTKQKNDSITQLHNLSRIQNGGGGQEQQNNYYNQQLQANKINILYQNHKSMIEKAEDAWLALKELRSNPNNQTDMDKKLLQMIDPQILEVFNEYSQAIVEQDESQHNLNNNNSENSHQFTTNNNIILQKKLTLVGINNGSRDQINQEDILDSSSPSLIVHDTHKKLEHSDKINTFKKKSDFFLQFQPDKSNKSLTFHSQTYNHKNSSNNNEDDDENHSENNSNSNNNEDEKIENTQQKENVEQQNIKTEDIMMATKNNMNDSQYPLNDKDETDQKQIDHDQENNNYNLTQYDEFISYNTNQQEYQPDNSRIKSNINSTSVGIELQANKLLSKIKHQNKAIVNSSQEQSIQQQKQQQELSQQQLQVQSQLQQDQQQIQQNQQSSVIGENIINLPTQQLNLHNDDIIIISNQSFTEMQEQINH